MPMIDQSRIPGLKLLAEAAADVLPEDGDPAYVARAALDICTAGHWTDDARLVSAIDCARRYWTGRASEEERDKVRHEIVAHAEMLRTQGAGDSQEWCKYALTMRALDAMNSSNGFEVDYLLDFSLKAGIPLAVIRAALEAHVPGLSGAIAERSRT